MRKLALLKDTWDFLRTRRKWWLFPTILCLILLTGLIVYVFSSAVAPVLYPLF